ncbi:MAG: hypothetical protein AMS27_06470 [Bacteroides sp. SM23_62_1]|nr:MAG: hypothetical protein AMS27_06470 [Bacteroides sp. SM23_62_1]
MMVMKEFIDKQYVPQDTIVMQKDTVLISSGHDSVNRIIDSTKTLQTRDIISSRNKNDTIPIKYASNGENIPERIISADPITTPSTERSLSLVREIFPAEEIPYLLDTSDLVYNDHNPLTKFKDHYYITRDSSGLVFKKENSQVNSATLENFNKDVNNSAASDFDMSPDWLMGIIIVSLIVLAWLKLFYHKFINNTAISLWNFQLSKKEFRDQNIFSRRVAFILNLNYIIIGGLFIYLVFSYFRINPYNLGPFPLYLFSAGLLLIILLINQILLLLAGFIFNQQENFMEYLHQILLIYKNIGIFFIPVVLCIAYIQDNLRIYLIISGIALFLLGYLFRFVKGIQIIIKKDVLLLYLILYLCTLEILPVVIYCKFFSSWL